MSIFSNNDFFRHLKLDIGLPIPASNDENYIDRKGIPPGPDQGEYPSYLCSYHHLKLDIALAIPASNDVKY